MLVKNDLFDYENRSIYQDSEYFKFSLDSILLAEYVDIKKDDIVTVDLCAGNMAIPLILSKYSNNKIFGFEIQEEVYNLGRKSIELNHLEHNLTIINDDVKNIGMYFDKKSIDLMVCNPPFFKANDEKMVNKTMEKKIARHEIFLTLEDIFYISKNYLKDNGNLYMVHRASRLDEIIILAKKYNIGVKNVCLVKTKEDKEPNIVLIKCVKNCKFGLKFDKIVCVANLTTYQHLFKEQK